MTSMDYFRRPALVGKNVQRTVVATVRGSVRRSEADGTSGVPYFPNLVIGQTLNITHQGGSVVVTFTGIDITTVLADINTALGANGTAVNADGVVEIRSAVQGTAGLIQITGGSGASAIGFDVYGGGRPIEARGAQIPSSPEARLGNPFGVTFLGRENLNNESVTRGLASIASNTDVLWADQTKERLQMRKVSFSVGGDRLYITPTAAQRVFIGSANTDNLTAASLKRDLIPYFQLIDTATGLPAASQVVAVVRGTPVGAPPYANSPSWTDTSGKNILGQDQTKISAASINTITEGRIVEVLGETFITKGVVAGDLAEITGATNTTRWSNNGYRWIIEQVLSETAVVLRPMSASELTMVGTSVTDIQPILDLNDEKSGLETFGSITIRNGIFAHGVNLVVRPQIPPGASYELYAAVPANLRSSVGFEDVKDLRPSLLAYGSDNVPVHNGTLSGAVASLSAGDIAITAGIIRWNGHVHSIPATTITNASLSNGINYVYWDEETLTYKATLTPTNFASVFNPAVTTNKGHLIAIVGRFGGVITAVSSANRLIADAARTVTVGPGGQFANLDQAINFISAFSIAWTETTTSNGTFPHFEIILVGDTTFVGSALSMSVSAPGLIIRGISKGVVLTMSGSFVLDECPNFEIRDLSVTLTGPTLTFVDQRSTTSNSQIRIKNISQSAGGGVFEYVVRGGSPGVVERVLIEDSSFLISTGIVTGTPSSTDTGIIELLKSDFTFSSGVASPQMITSDAGTTWPGGKLSIDRCNFFGSWLTNSTNALCVATSDAGSVVLVRDSLFQVGTHTSTSNASLFILAGRGQFDRVRMEPGPGTIPTFVNGTLAVVSQCELQCNPESTQIAVNAASVFNTGLTHMDTDGNVVGGVGIQVVNRAYGNAVLGPFAYGIRTNSDNVSVVSNRVLLSDGTNAKPLIGIDSQSENRVLINENFVSMPNRPSADPVAAPAGISQTVTPFYETTIQNNQVTLSENGDCIRVGTSASPVSGENLIISGNLLFAQCTLGGVSMGIRLHGTVYSALVHGNQIFESGLGTSSGIYQDSGDYTQFHVTDNRVFVDAAQGTGGVYFCVTPNSTQEVSGNFFQAGTATQKVSGFRGNTVGNQFLSAGTFLISDCQGVFCDNYVSVSAGSATLGSGRYDNNTFGIANVNGSVTVVDMQFTNNSLTGNFNSGSSSTDHMTFSGNKVAGSTTIGNSVSTKLIVVGNELLGALTISNGSSTTDVVVTSTYVGGAADISANNSLVVSDCVFKDTGTQTITGNTYCMVSDCQFFGSLTMAGFASNQTITGCQIYGNVVFTQDVTPLRWEVSDCLIQPSSTSLDGITFPAFTFPAVTEIGVRGNTIRLGASGGGGAAIQASAIRFLGGGSRLNITGNTVEMIGSTDPGGAGTPTYACVKIDGALANDGVVFSSNLMEKHGDLNFRAGALIITYKFISAANASQLGGAGNILLTGGVTAGGAGQGGVFYHAGVGAFAL